MKKENSPSSREEKPKFVDDGRTLYDMSGLDDMRGTRRKDNGVKLTRAEKRAIIKAAFAQYAPIFFGVLACFTLAAVLIYFWLSR